MRWAINCLLSTWARLHPQSHRNTTPNLLKGHQPLGAGFQGGGSDGLQGERGGVLSCFPALIGPAGDRRKLTVCYEVGPNSQKSTSCHQGCSVSHALWVTKYRIADVTSTQTQKSMTNLLFFSPKREHEERKLAPAQFFLLLVFALHFIPGIADFL